MTATLATGVQTDDRPTDDATWRADDGGIWLITGALR